ncbi:ornithine decarboxylase 1-like [Drosophila tropicalis]|uniref:ornithine decarboxylase 1-like n=1 Tax=Drosophila tropicalis TaxID=46794 RepID=UPI0035ABB437
MRLNQSEISHYDKQLNTREIIKKTNFKDLDESVYICDLSSVEQKLYLWQRYLPRIKPYYAVKCNNDPMIIKTLADLGTGFDCASKNELKLVLGSKVSPERIIFANPCRLISHVEYSRQQKVFDVTVDNEFEVYKLHKHYSNSNLILRFKSEAKAAKCPLGDKFGCDPNVNAAALLLLAKALDLKVTGTSFHVGSGCSEFAAYDRAIGKAKQIFDFGKLIGHKMNLLDIGGGFPGANDEEFEKIANVVNESLERDFSDPGIKIISEPGRFFVESAFTLICKIHAKREVLNAMNGKLELVMYYLNDGVFGSFNNVISYNEFVLPQHYLENEQSLPLYKSLLWGPTCDAVDKISKHIFLPHLNRGDLIGFHNMGAYTFPIASEFNGFQVPKILYFKAKKERNANECQIK